MDDITCSLCGASLDENPGVNFVPINQDKGVYLCETCLMNMYDKLASIREESRQQDLAEIAGEPDEAPPELPKLPKPEEIRAFLDQYVIGQDAAKKIFSVAVYNHYKELAYQRLHETDRDAVEIQKSNIVMVGPSGSGKTELVRTLAKCMGVPLAICDASSLSATGYVGADPVSVLTDLLSRADGDVIKAQMGIVFIDEFDKLAKKNDDNTHKDVTGEGVQQELLKIIEGNVVDVPATPGKKLFSESVKLDTSNILFICGGAFDGIEETIRKRLNKKDNLPNMGFGKTASKSANKTKEYNQLIRDVTTDDLKEYGIIREMLGRLPVICPVLELTQDELVRVLTEPKSAICKQYQALFAMDDATLTFRASALQAIAKDAIKRKTGARGLRSIIERILTDTMYQIPKEPYPVDVVVTADCVTKHAKPNIYRTKEVDLVEKLRLQQGM